MDVFGEKSCSICMKDTNTSVDYISVIMPCLHTMCSPCMDEIVSRDITKCHICRGDIEGVLESVGGEEKGGEDDIYNMFVVSRGPDGCQIIDLTMD